MEQGMSLTMQKVLHKLVQMQLTASLHWDVLPELMQLSGS